MATTHGTPAAHLLGWLERARDDLGRLHRSGLDPDDLADGATVAYRRWWHDPDTAGLRQLLDDLADAHLDDHPTRRDRLVARLDLATAEAAHDDPLSHTLATRRALRLRAAVPLLVAQLAAGPDLTDAFEALRAAVAAGVDDARAQVSATHPRLFDPRTVADLRRAVLLSTWADSPPTAGTTPGYPLTLAVADDDPWADHVVDPLPPGTPLPGGVLVARDRHGTSHLRVAFDDPLLALLQPVDATSDQVVDPYDWARSRTARPAPLRRYVPLEIERSFARVAALADDPALRRLRAGIRSERRAAAALADTPGLHAVINGLRLDGGDADHLAIGPQLAVVETKTGRGRVTLGPPPDADDDQGPAARALLADGRPLYGEDGSPLGQVLRQAGALAELLADAGEPAVLDTVVCVTDMVGPPQVHELPDGTVHVCSVADLPAVVAGLPARLTAATARRVTRLLAGRLEH